VWQQLHADDAVMEQQQQQQQQPAEQQHPSKRILIGRSHKQVLLFDRLCRCCCG
jgi:hypothetical protein